MTRNDILDQKGLKRQCVESVKVLKENNCKLNELKEAYQEARHVKMSGQTAKSIINYCDDEYVIIRALYSANESDIVDHNALAALLGEETLNGATILTNKQNAYMGYLRDTSNSSSAYATANSLEDWRVAEIGYYRYLGWSYARSADNYYREYLSWKQREEWFDNVCALSATLFKDGTPFRTLALEGMKELAGEFKNGEYTVSGDSSWKDGIIQLRNKVKIADKCKENWKDSNGNYDLELLKEVLDKDSTQISATEYDALCEVLAELPIEDQHKLLDGKVQIVDAREINYVKGAFNTIGSCGTVGSVVKDAYTLGNAVLSGDSDKVAKACVTLGKDWMSRFGSYAKNAFSETPNTIKTLIGDCKKYSFAKTILNTEDEVAIQFVAPGEYAGEAFLSEIKGFKWNKVATNATKADKFATAGKNVKVVTKWAGAVVSAGFNYFDNIAEQDEDSTMSDARVYAETAVETITDISLGAAGTAVAALLLGPAAPAIAVGAASAAIVWGANELVEYTTGKDIGEHFADVACDTAETVGSLGHALLFGGQ